MVNQHTQVLELGTTVLDGGAFFGLVGVKWDEEHTSDKGVVHFHERIGKDR